MDAITKSYLTKKFCDFVTPSTINFFERFHIPKDVLYQPTDRWTSLEPCKKGLRVVNQLKVANDTAERSVQLMVRFIGALTKNDTEYQELVMVVDEYITKRIPNIQGKNCCNFQNFQKSKFK